MVNTTNVPQPTFGPNGFLAPPESEILTGLFADYNAAFGGNLNVTNLTTPQGQLVSSETALVGNVNDTFLFFTNQVDPAFAQGRMQDAIARIYFIERNPAQPTVIQVTCVGLQNVVIVEGALIIDTLNNVYTCTATGVIPISGSITLQFANVNPGPIAIPSTVQIYTSISGWDTVTVISGVLGNNVESRSAFEARRAQSVAHNSIGALPSIVGRVLEVPDVIDAFVTENNTNGPLTVGGFTLQANSLYVAAVGGDSKAIATAIWQGALACSYNGNTTVTIYDTNSGYNPPYPSYNITFEIPPPLPIIFSVVILNSPAVPSDAATQIQNAIIGAFAGEDGGTRARIGNTLLASRYYAPVANLGSWAQIVDIEIGSQNISTAQYTATIAPGTMGHGNMTVSSVASGTLAAGQTVLDVNGVVLAGTQILSQTSGSAGSTGVYVVSVGQTVASPITMLSVVSNLFKVVCQINQVPTITAANITVTLQ